MQMGIVHFGDIRKTYVYCDKTRTKQREKMCLALCILVLIIKLHVNE